MFLFCSISSLVFWHSDLEHHCQMDAPQPASHLPQDGPVSSSKWSLLPFFYPCYTFLCCQFTQQIHNLPWRNRGVPVIPTAQWGVLKELQWQNEVAVWAGLHREVVHGTNVYIWMMLLCAGIPGRSTLIALSHCLTGWFGTIWVWHCWSHAHISW